MTSPVRLSLRGPPERTEWNYRSKTQGELTHIETTLSKFPLLGNVRTVVGFHNEPRSVIRTFPVFSYTVRVSFAPALDSKLGANRTETDIWWCISTIVPFLFSELLARRWLLLDSRTIGA